MNEAYDNLDSMAMGNTNRGSSEYAEPVTPNGTHPSAQTAPRQDPTMYFTGKHSKKEKKIKRSSITSLGPRKLFSPRWGSNCSVFQPRGVIFTRARV